MKFLTYNPEQAYLLPPSVREVLGEDHVCFFLHHAVERLDWSAFEPGYVEEGRAAYHPALLLKVWLYAYVLGITSSRRLEQRVQEDLAFRYLAAGAAPDHWTLNDFRRRHGRALNEVFTQVVEIARSLGLGRLGHVAIDSTRIAANASRDRVETVKGLRAERASIRRQIRRWQKQCDAGGPDEAPGQRVGWQRMQALEQRARTDSATPGAIAQERAGAPLPDRSRQPLSSRPQRIHLGVHRGDRGERRSPDPGAAGHAESPRQQIPAAPGRCRRAALRRATTEGERR